MILSDTSSKIEVRLGYPVATTELSVTACFADETTTTFTPDTNSTLTNGITWTTSVGSPGASTQRIIKSITVYNTDTKPAMFHVRHFDGSTGRESRRIGLNPGDTAHYSYGRGWDVIDKYGFLRKDGSMTHPLGTIRRPPHQSVTSTGTKALVATTTYAVYLGPADRDFAQVKLAWKVTTLASTITWAEVAIATGAFVHGAGTNLTLLGTALNIAAVINSTGAKLSTVVAAGKMGDELWALIGTNAVVAGTLRAGIADISQTGNYLTATARPSTMAANTAFALESGIIAPPLFALQLV